MRPTVYPLMALLGAACMRGSDATPEAPPAAQSQDCMVGGLITGRTVVPGVLKVEGQWEETSSPKPVPAELLFRDARDFNSALEFSSAADGTFSVNIPEGVEWRLSASYGQWGYDSGYDYDANFGAGADVPVCQPQLGDILLDMISVIH